MLILVKVVLCTIHEYHYPSYTEIIFVSFFYPIKTEDSSDEKNRLDAIRELVETEKTYVNTLNDVKKVCYNGYKKWDAFEYQYCSHCIDGGSY